MLYYHIEVLDVTTGLLEFAQQYECIEDTCTEESLSGFRACISHRATVTAYENGGPGVEVYPPNEFETDIAGEY